MKLSIFQVALLTLVTYSVSVDPSYKNVTQVPRQINKKIYVHLMPWFETRQSSEDGNWGIHWTMSNQNPELIVGEGNKQQIASHYYPDIHPYPSGDGALIDYQIQMMRYAGIDGVLVDWPGTAQGFDYPKNARNADNFINKLESAGLEFAIVYEDHNLKLGQDAGFIPDMLDQGKRDMEYLQNNYFGRNNYIKINGNPLLMTFGPQALKESGQWDNLFSVLSPRPTFLTLWYQMQEAGTNAQGEYPWIYNDFLEGLRNFYNNRPLPVKFGVCYPGFNTFYAQGGWPGPDWNLPTGPDTFRQTLDIALDSDVQWIQVATWNDYGEGTIVEPTREFGNTFLNMLQTALKVPFGNRELGLIKELYQMRQEFKGRSEIEDQLQHVNEALNNVQPDKADELLQKLRHFSAYNNKNNSKMRFSEVSAPNYSLVFDSLQKRLPRSSMSCNILTMLLKNLHPPTIHTKVYALDEKITDSELFITIIQYREIYDDNAIIISSPDNTTEEMVSAFDALVDWSKEICFSAIDITFSKHVAKLCVKNGKLANADPCNFMAMSLTEAKSINVEPLMKANSSLEVKELSPSDAKLVASRWKFSQENTEQMLADTIKHLPSTGIFLQGKLVSWVVVYAIGSVNALFTEEEYRGKGFGGLTMRNACKMAGDKGLFPNVQVQLGNIASERLMAGVGFRKSHLVEWVIFRPHNTIST